MKKRWIAVIGVAMVLLGFGFLLGRRIYRIEWEKPIAQIEYEAVDPHGAFQLRNIQSNRWVRVITPFLFLAPLDRCDVRPIVFGESTFGCLAFYGREARSIDEVECVVFRNSLCPQPGLGQYAPPSQLPNGI